MMNGEQEIHSSGRDSAESRGGAPPIFCMASTAPRVLVVDDDPIDRKLAHAKLQILGCDVVTVASGEAALAAVAAEAFDLVFMDCRMPGLDGFETTRRLRRREARGQVAHRGRLPVIAATANPGYRDCCEAAGMIDVLVKPYTRDEIRIRLGRWLADPGDDLAETRKSFVDPRSLAAFRSPS